MFFEFYFLDSAFDAMRLESEVRGDLLGVVFDGRMSCFSGFQGVIESCVISTHLINHNDNYELVLHSSQRSRHFYL